MPLNLVNNNYVGEIVGDLATLLTLGATDLGLFHVMTTTGSKLRFPYASVDTVIQTFDSLCAVTDAGGRNREIVDMELKRFIIQEVACKDEEFSTDYANATNGYESQTLSSQISEWARMHVDNYSAGLQNVRWSGDTASGVALLAKHDGVVKLIKAKGAYDETTNPTGYQKIATTAITASNAIQEIGKVADALELNVSNHSGVKIIVAPAVVKAMKQQLRNAKLTIGLNDLPKVNLNIATGQITDGSCFGAPIYVAHGLAATVANSNIVMAGIFEDSRMGILKLGVTEPNEEKSLTLKEVRDGDAIRMRAIHSQAVAVIPNLSQMAMNA